MDRNGCKKMRKMDTLFGMDKNGYNGLKMEIKMDKKGYSV
jgi:hypothetical protein